VPQVLQKGARGVLSRLSVTEKIGQEYEVSRKQETGTYDVGEWRGGQKSTIWGVHPNGSQYKILIRQPAIEMSMDELVMPRGWKLREIRPCEFGPVEVLKSEDDLINESAHKMDENRARKWRGGGGSH
jgi:hypothetical protein